MIRSLHGNVIGVSGVEIIVDVHGVGYLVYASQELLRHATKNNPITVFVHTHIREDCFDLYGFSSLQEVSLFERIIGISGIGPKTALGIFSVGDRNSILHAISINDVVFFTRVPRLGKKNAQKLILEMKNKTDLLEFSLDEFDPGEGEVVAALQQFGFSQQEAQAVLQKLDVKEKSIEEKIKLALKYLGK